jgi:hypothetical protein
VDCVIAEVKEPAVEFNEPIRRPDGLRLIASALRMFGVFPAARLRKMVWRTGWPRSREHR